MDGGMLSQDEINALLSSMDLSGDGDTTAQAVEDVQPEPVLQEELSKDDYLTGSVPIMGDDTENLLTDVEKDAIGEVANISMGSSATTLYSLVNRKVNITTPVVKLATWENLLEHYEDPCVFIQIKYTQGLDGTNILVLKEKDVKVITDLMMGGDGTNTEGEISELHLSAISEAMNQMMGSAATSLSTMLKTVIDISPPDSSLLDLTSYKSGEEIAPFLGGVFVKIAFRMQIDELVDSTIMQLYPVDFARKLVETFINTQMGGDMSSEGSTATDTSQSAASMSDMGTNSMGSMDMSSMSGMGTNSMGSMDMSSMGGMDAMNGMGMSSMGGMNAMNGMGMNPMGSMNAMNGMGMNPMGGMNAMNGMGMSSMGGMNAMNGMGMNPMGMNYMNGMGMNPMGGMPQMNVQNVNVQPAQFQSFSGDLGTIEGQENIGLIMDVPLEVTVELGRTSKNISEILNFAPGTIIELNRIAGEPIDVLVNGKFVAKGEVVVIEESFGVRVTEIIK